MVRFPAERRGYKAIATPGELHGLWTSFKRFGSGRIAWQDLVMPSAQLLSSGYPVSELMEKVLRFRRKDLLENKSMKDTFTNPSTGELYKEGEIIKNVQLAETLTRIALSSDPVKLFYKGEIAQEIGREMSANGAFLSLKDLAAYESTVDEAPLHNDHSLGDLTMCGPPPPSSFSVAQLIIAAINGMYKNGTAEDALYNDPQFYHYLIEAQKFAFAIKANLGDGEQVPEAHLLAVNMTSSYFIDKVISQIKENAQETSYYGAQFAMFDDEGTSHVSVVDSYGNAVSATTSINYGFGSLRRNEKLGIIWNDHIDDFSLPSVRSYLGMDPSESNFLAPRKRPMSSMCPIVIFNKTSSHVKMVVGAAGGSKIISAVAQTVLRAIIFNETVKDAVDAPRLHNQFTPFDTQYEEGFPQEMLLDLESRGQNMTKARFPSSTVQAIVRDSSDYLTASSDHRRPVNMYPAGF